VLCGRSRLDEPREHLESSSRHGCAAPLLIGDSCTRSGAAGQGWRPPGCDHRVVDGRPGVHNPLSRTPSNRRSWSCGQPWILSSYAGPKRKSLLRALTTSTFYKPR